MKTKNTILMIALVAIGFASCQKESGTQEVSDAKLNNENGLAPPKYQILGKWRKVSAHTLKTDSGKVTENTLDSTQFNSQNYTQFAADGRGVIESGLSNLPNPGGQINDMATIEHFTYLVSGSDLILTLTDLGTPPTETFTIVKLNPTDLVLRFKQIAGHGSTIVDSFFKRK